MKLYLGKIDYNDCGKKINLVEIDWEFKGDKFTMSGGIWNSKKTDYLQCGQCLDTIKRFFPKHKIFNEMYEIWQKWHLNDLKAGSPQQEHYINSLCLKKYDYDIVRNELKKIHLLKDQSFIHNGQPYEYGTAWLKAEIPIVIKNQIKSWTKYLTTYQLWLNKKGA